MGRDAMNDALDKRTHQAGSLPPKDHRGNDPGGDSFQFRPHIDIRELNSRVEALYERIAALEAALAKQRAVNEALAKAIPVFVGIGTVTLINDIDSLEAALREALR